MNYRTSTMQKSNNWRVPSDGSVAHKLLSIELEHHHETQSLRREIKRLRAEVGLMARLRNFHKAETDRLAEILRKLPPPIIPTRETTKVATPPNPQNDTTVQERGRPRARDGNGSDNSPSHKDGKKRTSLKGKEKEVDTPMADNNDHTIGKIRNDTNVTQPKKHMTRSRSRSVISTLRNVRPNIKSPAPKPPTKEKDLAKAKKERRREKERIRTKEIVKEVPEVPKVKRTAAMAVDEARALYRMNPRDEDAIRKLQSEYLMLKWEEGEKEEDAEKKQGME